MINLAFVINSIIWYCQRMIITEKHNVGEIHSPATVFADIAEEKKDFGSRK